MITGISVRQIVPSNVPMEYKKQANRLIKTLVGSMELKEGSRIPPNNPLHDAADYRVKKIMRILSTKFPDINVQESIKEFKASIKPKEKPIGLFSKFLIGFKKLFNADLFIKPDKSSVKALHRLQY